MEPDSARVPLLEKPFDDLDLLSISKTQIIPEPFYITYICCCCSDKSDLTTLEYTSFESLVSRCNISFDSSNSEHRDKLSTFLALARAELIKHKPQFQSEEQGLLWKEFGFQTNSPENDFRGGGLMSLECMIHFGKSYSQELGEMFNTEFFCFAIIVIKLCFKMRLLFRLFDKEDLNKQIQLQKNNNMCNRRELKRFCNSLIKEKGFFYKIVDYGLLITWKKYVQRLEIEKGVLNILKIDGIVDEAVNAVKEAFQEHKDHESIQNALIKQHNDINIHK